MASSIERHIAALEADLAKANEDHAGVSGEKVLIQGKISALDAQVKKLEADKTQRLRELGTCEDRLSEIEAEQSALTVQLDALRKAV